jgi:hypothetical protein
VLAASLPRRFRTPTPVHRRVSVVVADGRRGGDTRCARVSRPDAGDRPGRRAEYAFSAPPLAESVAAARWAKRRPADRYC